MKINKLTAEFQCLIRMIQKIDNFIYPIHSVMCNLSNNKSKSCNCGISDIHTFLENYDLKSNYNQEPYLDKIIIEKVYNPAYGDDRICVCGHQYYRHFDSYPSMDDEDYANIGCKYCDCDNKPVYVNNFDYMKWKAYCYINKRRGIK